MQKSIARDKQNLHQKLSWNNMNKTNIKKHQYYMKHKSYISNCEKVISSSTIHISAAYFLDSDFCSWNLVPNEHAFPRAQCKALRMETTKNLQKALYFYVIMKSELDQSFLWVLICFQKPRIFEICLSNPTSFPTTPFIS